MEKKETQFINIDNPQKNDIASLRFKCNYYKEEKEMYDWIDFNRNSGNAANPSL